MWKSLVRICVGIGIVLGGLLAFGIGSIFWKYYTIKRPPEKRSTGDKYLLFLNFAPRYPYTKISLPPWEEWKVIK